MGGGLGTCLRVQHRSLGNLQTHTVHIGMFLGNHVTVRIGCEFRVIAWFVVWGVGGGLIMKGGDVLFVCSMSPGKPLTFLWS